MLQEYINKLCMITKSNGEKIFCPYIAEFSEMQNLKETAVLIGINSMELTLTRYNGLKILDKYDFLKELNRQYHLKIKNEDIQKYIYNMVK